MGDEMTDHLPSVLSLVIKERVRQEQLKKDGKFKHTCADTSLSNHECLTILTEEVGEVARAVLEYEANDGHEEENYNHIIEELIQVAAVAVATVEGLFENDRVTQIEESLNTCIDREAYDEYRR